MGVARFLHRNYHPSREAIYYSVVALDLPERRAELYKRCVETLLTEWDAKRNICRRREFKPEHKRQLLTEIAWHFHLQGQRYFAEQEVLTLVAGFLPKVHLAPELNGQILTEIANEHDLLKEQARGWQGFLHYFIISTIDGCWAGVGKSRTR
ncbi:MAG: hypothetical protein H0U76_31050 [Ktedonobacteraceae bacterium]|nr:hypothetical protein [Ktedonobacteraceae bacterium]